MRKDKRIKLYKNTDHRGALYTKANCILKAKGKYIMLLDMDDMYVQRDAFSTIYTVAEKYDLDILSFGLLMKFVETGKEMHYKILNTPIILKPEIAKNVYNHTEKNEIIRTGGMLVNYLFKNELGKKSVKMIEDKFMNQIINFHDDLFIFFLLIRNANRFKRISRIFYFVLKENALNKNQLFRLKEKRKDSFNWICNGCINYLEFLLNHTENSFADKAIAEKELKNWYLNFRCKFNNYTKNML